MSDRWKSAFSFGAVGLLLLFVALWQTLLSFAQVWFHSTAYQHAWLVLPTVIYLLGWHYRSEFLASNPVPDLLGVAVAALSGVLWGGSTLMNIAVGQQFSLILALQGVLMAALGWRVYRAFFPVFGLLFLMVPSGDLLQPALLLLTVKAIEWFAVMLQLPHSIDGFLIVIGRNRYLVLDECSGLSQVNLAVFLGYSFGAAMYRSFTKVIAFAMLGALIGIVSNVLRVNSIVLIDWLVGSQMPLASHTNIQWVILLVMLGLLFYILTRLDAEPKSRPDVIKFQRKSTLVFKLAPVLAAVSVLLVSFGLNWQTASVQPIESSVRSKHIPVKLLGWEAAAPIGLSVIDPLGQNEAAVFDYRRNDQLLRVQVVTTVSPSAKLRDSWLIPGDQTQWRQTSVENRSLCNHVKCIDLRHATWTNHKSGKTTSMYYAYSIGSFTTTSKLALRGMHGWHRLNHHSRNSWLITMVFEGDEQPAGDIATLYQTIESNL